MGLSIWHLLLVLIIVALVFGTKRLRNIGGDLGSAIKSFKSSMGDAEAGRDEESERRLEDPSRTMADDIYDADHRDRATQVRDKDKV